MTEIDWLIGHSFESLTRRDFDWAIAFDQETRLGIGCLWRLIEDGRIRFTSEDDGQQFGLPAPVNAAAEVNHRLARALVEGVDLRDGTLDLDLRFTTGHVLQIVPTSSGYEAWNLHKPGRGQFIAVGGGELAIIQFGSE